MSDIATYYHNEKEGTDSLTYWTHIIDSIASMRNEFPDVSFEAKAMSCQDLFWAGNYEQGLSDAIELYHLAFDNQQNYGLIRCSDCLGQFYQAIRRDSDAAGMLARYKELVDEQDLFHWPLYNINELLKEERLAEDLQFKDNILKRQGRLDEALVL